MPNIAAAATPIICGDFKAGYRIYDRIELQVTPDLLTQRITGLARFYARRRVGAWCGPQRCVHEAENGRISHARRYRPRAGSPVASWHPYRDASGFLAGSGGAGRSAGRYAFGLGWYCPAEIDFPLCGDPCCRHRSAGGRKASRPCHHHPLAEFARYAQAACLALIAAILPVDQGEAEPSGSGLGKPLREYFTDLFRFGTGWLGWTPSEAWNASIAELETAFLAHVDRVVIMTPGAVPTDLDNGAGVYTKERLQQIEEQGFDPAFDREGLRAMKAKYQ
ncbi:phage major capsid protein [Paenirhodobacter populi]|uniref:phage major capsid protein n=1 Tax=Paenirhodobacter populi TaxID=2306993 RepID=UPI00240D6E59|nr:phage major capsid protein [Sinirhodobacter populi]